MTSSWVFLMQALVVLALPLALSVVWGVKRMVPLVVVQIVVGIALGPSVLGRIAPDIYHMFVNPASLPALSGIGMVAVLVFSLITGLHFDSRIFSNGGRTISAIVIANMLVPTAFGCAAGLWILGRHPEELASGVTGVEFAMAIGVCTGVTALPVLGAILSEMKLLDSRIGHLALGVAGIKDAMLWIFLGVLLTISSKGEGGISGILGPLAFIPVYLILMIFFGRRVLRRMVTARMQDGAIHESTLAIVCAIAIASALATEAMGMHYLIGAFVTGAVMPTELRRPILDRLQAMTAAVLMPFFFTLTGMRTLIEPGSAAFLDIFAAATAASVFGIVGCTGLVARVMGESWNVSLVLGALLQTKGLMELVVLTIFLDAGIISANAFAALVVMAVFVTALAMPAAKLLLACESRRVRRAESCASSTQRV